MGVCDILVGMVRGILGRGIAIVAMVAAVLPGCGRLLFDWDDGRYGVDAGGDAASPDASNDASWDARSDDAATDAMLRADTGSVDAAAMDSAARDANATDANRGDANTSDAATADAAMMDAAIGDAATADAGTDAATMDAGDAGSCGMTGCACIRFVNPMSAGPQDGLSWSTGFHEVQAAIDDAALAVPVNGGCEVWVRAGRYFVYASDVMDTIAMRPRVDVYGGFAGNESNRFSRDLNANATILDGHDITNTLRVYHVVTGAGPARLDGFTITGGHAIGAPPHHRGGGLFAVSGAWPLVVGCTFDGNDTSEAVGAHGGGAAFVGNGNTRLQACIFINNRALDGAAIYANGGALRVLASTFQANIASGSGGAIAADNVNLEVTAGHFFNNQANANGGAISSVGTNLKRVRVEASELRTNIAGGNGGAISVDGEPLELSNDVIGSNTAGGNGGGLYLNNPGVSDVSSVTIANNTAGGFGTGVSAACPNLLCAFRNDVLWNPSARPELQRSGSTFFTHSVVRGGVAGTAILNSDPLLQASPVPFALGPGSPAIDAADGCYAPATDFTGSIRLDVTSVSNTGIGVPADIGAIEMRDGTTPAPWSVATCCGPAVVLPGGNRAYACPAEVPWASARDLCGAVGGTLVSIANNTEANLVTSIAANPGWIGLSHPAPTIPLRWEDGSALTFTNWNTNEPTGGNQLCVRAVPGGTWEDDLCSTRHAMVCEVP